MGETTFPPPVDLKLKLREVSTGIKNELSACLRRGLWPVHRALGIDEYVKYQRLLRRQQYEVRENRKFISWFG